MAISGDFDHLPFIDLTRILAHQTGTLFLRTAYAGRSVELHLDRTELRGLYVNGFPINEPARLHDILHTLITSATGTFEFQPTELSALTPHLKLPLLGLLEQHGMAALTEAQLPHPDTRFQTVTRPPEPPAALASTWTQVHARLDQGSSAADLASSLHLPELQTRELFYRLRLAGLITPVRAAPLNTEDRPMAETKLIPPTVSAAPEPSPVRRLLNALRRFTAVPGRA